ncbi:unnamed protein product [Adineta ricciae]|uniref:Uncharacterized protein n=1 Tax=Adineta ricciae TaxID=249248 RepID=A0A814SH22_ADIRI|nr:unnamed protein product [Adineta ricciae]
MKLSESTILAITAAIAGVATLFTLIGLTTPKWLRNGYGLWNCNNVCSPSTATLTILSLFCLVASFVLLIILLIRAFPRKFRCIPLCLLIIGTLFLLISTASYLRHARIIGYSYELVVTGHAFAYFASIILAFWFGTTMNEKSTARPIAQPLNIALPMSRGL